MPPVPRTSSPPCGMNCALCRSYQAQQNDLKSKGFGYQSCPGYIPRGKHCLPMRDHCDTVGKGLVRFCFPCADFCTRLKRLDERYRSKYHMSMIETLQMIRDQGLNTFVKDQATRWSYTQCGKHLICCHNGLCLHCDLAFIKEHRRFRLGENKRGAEE